MEPDDKPGSSRPQQPGTDAVNTLAGAQYASPQCDVPTGGLPPQPASHWDRLREEPACKRSRVLEAGETSSSCELHADADLGSVQREVLNKVIATLDTSNTSVVITNPLRRDNPIVFVTKPWENMCGFTYDEAVGKNPRVTQGEHSDPATIGMMSSALREHRACKVMMLNYRSGNAARPFYNMLSISPILHQGKLMLYLANLQDYSYHMAKLVSTPPSQFCRSATFHQRARALPSGDELSLRAYARPAVFELDESTASAQALAEDGSSGGAQGAGAALQLKRLGWSNLTLEPEHLTDRVVDALHQLDARYERVENSADSGDIFVVNAEISGVACRVLITAEPNGQSFRIACTRLGGDTFTYHDVFRQLRTLLGDAVAGAVPLEPRRNIAGWKPLALAPLPPPRLALAPAAGGSADAGPSAAGAADNSFSRGSSIAGGKARVSDGDATSSS